ncbi:protein kinase domain-containing protein [Streptomyces avermitilis]|uniref:protein kinase domain-containing protein n=1 Tax=Streptomyces avermitilis TaxID=33903 RepID=UPI00369B14F9
MGEVFAGRYELVDPIGRGGVGAVWRAWDHRRRRYVAAKVLQQSDAHALLRFVREQAMRIDHPHVLAPASWAADDDKVLFTMDLVAGGSLVHLIGDYGPLPPSFVCTLLDQLLSGLTAVHAEGVVHRDIKPANVLLEATGTGRPRLRLSDFGIAMRLGEPRLTETNYVVGTPGYLAPEQLMGDDPDFPADLFAVGLVALYLLEGAKPDARALIEYFLANGTPAAPRGIPEPLWQVVAVLLQPDPAARFRTATGARKALAAAAELLPEPGPDDELVEIFDQLGPLPPGFGTDGPLKRAPGVTAANAVPQQPGLGSTGSTPSGDDSSSGSRPGRPNQRPNRGHHDPGAASGTASGAAPGTGSTGGVRPAEGSGEVTPTTGSSRIPPEPDSGPPQPGPPTPLPPPPNSAPLPPQPASAPGSAPGPGPVQMPPLPDATPSRSFTMSDTGSFHLPPPRPSTPVRPQPLPERPPTPPASVALPSPAYAPHLEPTRVPSPRPSAAPAASVQHHAYASAGAHTAPAAQVHTRPQSISRRRRRRPKRPGPPAKVAVPVLLLALACFAVGFWALAQI